MVEISVKLLTAEELRDSIKKCRNIAIPEPKKQCRLQGVIRNLTQFSITISGDPYFDSGRYEEPPPSEIEPFNTGSFTAASYQGKIEGATGGNVWKLQIEKDIEFNIALGFTCPLIGTNKAAILESTSAKEGYNAATEYGNEITSMKLYTGEDEQGNETGIRFRCTAAVNSPRRLYEIKQVIS